MKLYLRILPGIVILATLASAGLARPKAKPCELSPLGKVTGGSQRRTLSCQIGKDKREALVFAPSLGTNLPVIFAWHGHGGTMQGAAQQMHLQTLWPEAIVVYSQGRDTPTGHDLEGDGAGWQKETNQVGDRDLKFFDAMLATLRQNFSVDDARIYTTGFSNGTGFSYLLWVERGDKLAAIGAVAGILAESERTKLSQPRALIAIGPDPGQGTPQGPVQDTIERARQVNNATGPGQPCPIPTGATDCDLYPSTTHTPVKQISHTLGHVYPPWAPDEIVKFFKNHKKT